MMPRPPGSSLSYPLCPYPTLCRSGHDGLEQREQRGAVLLAVEPCDRVERRALHRQAVRLLILDHLEPVLNPPQHRIMIGQPRRDVGGDPSRLCKRRERVDRRGCAQRRLAATVDELMHLREEFDLADAAAPALEVVARAEGLPLREMVADAVAHRADFLRSEEHTSELQSLMRISYAAFCLKKNNTYLCFI